MPSSKQFYINGHWANPATSNDFEIINPSTEAVCATISLGSQADTDAAVAAAKAALPTWRNTSKEQRIVYMQKIAEVYANKMEEMANAITTEMGAPRALSSAAQAAAGMMHIKTFIDTLQNFEFERPVSDKNTSTRIVMEPIGVCALITPWNWPMNQVTLKVMAAIASGCTMVLKPSEIAPLSSLLFAEIIDQANLPAGVFNLVNGDGAGVGTQLSTHPDVDMISFTGSTRAGKAISKNAADTIKRVSLELGGKGANIIFADADEKAIVRGARHCFQNSGQSCNAPTRMLVERSKYDEAVATAKSVAETTEVDIADKEGRHIGPVVSRVQFDKIQALINKGIEEGAELIAGGPGLPEHLDNGFFVKPTVFAGVNNGMTIAKEEIFGPVLSIIPFDTEEEAISIANDTVYGLTNYLQTSDATRARRVASQLLSGMVEINGKSLGGGSPFGGYKQSGNGREGGTWGLEDFLEVKAISGLTL